MAKGYCDGCQRERSDVKSVGRDSNGDPDAPDYCFICRKESTRGRVYDVKRKAYVNPLVKLIKDLE
jgi:hypothetical protein